MGKLQTDEIFHKKQGMEKTCVCSSLPKHTEVCFCCLSSVSCQRKSVFLWCGRRADEHCSLPVGKKGLADLLSAFIWKGDKMWRKMGYSLFSGLIFSVGKTCFGVIKLVVSALV